MTLALRPYQEIGRDFLAARSRAFLGDEMRLGKSAQAIAAADKIGAGRVLVVCPAVAVEVWRRQWALWSGRNVHVVERDPVAPAGADVTVVSYNRAVQHADILRAARWGVLIPDEAHFAKNPDALRTRAIYGPQGLGHSAGAIWPLSGTPAPKHAAELWPVMRAFGVTSMGYEAFVRTYCTFNRLDGRPTGTREDMIPELREMLGKFLLRRTRREVAPELPELEFDFLPLAGKAPAGWEDAPVDEAGLLGWMEDREHEDLRKLTAMAKAGPLIEHVRFALDNELLARTVIFGHHIEPLERIARELDGRLITGKQSLRERARVQDDFRAGRTRVVAANIQAAGTAIDLSAASQAYFLELSWVPGDNLQAANRLISLEKHEPVSADVATWPGSVDDRVQNVLIRRVRQLNQLY